MKEHWLQICFWTRPRGSAIRCSTGKELISLLHYFLPLHQVSPAELAEQNILTVSRSDLKVLNVKRKRLGASFINNPLSVGKAEELSCSRVLHSDWLRPPLAYLTVQINKYSIDEIIYDLIFHTKIELILICCRHWRLVKIICGIKSSKLGLQLFEWWGEEV